jgi:hypothetical protein
MAQYSLEVANDICDRVSNGQTLQVIADFYGVSIGTILNWVTKEETVDKYARAREAASDLFESKILERVELITPESAAADRVAIDTLKWIAARRSPKKYGDKITQELTGKDGQPIQQAITIKVEFDDDSEIQP